MAGLKWFVNAAKALKNLERYLENVKNAFYSLQGVEFLKSI